MRANWMKVIALFVLAAMLIASTGLAEAVDLAAIDWNARYTYAELEDQLQAIAETYPDVTELYPIGTTYQERTLWCMELTNPAIDKADKTGVTVVANIHGGERESASSAMYFAW